MSIANELELQMLSLINAERTSRGLDALQLEQDLNEAAEDHSEWMLEEDIFSHTGEDGSSPHERMQDAGFQFSGSWASAENVAWQSTRGAAGLSDDVVDLHNALMNSSGHRANILNPDFQYIGIGLENGDFDYGAFTYDSLMVTQNFARTAADVDLDPSEGGSGDPDPTRETPAEPTSGDDELSLDAPGTLNGLAGDDSLIGSSGADTLIGGDGNDTLKGSDTDTDLRDAIYGGDGNDEISGAHGNDELRGDNGNDTIDGGFGVDTVIGGNGNDVLSGGAFSDVVFGGNGNDFINGGFGSDRLNGGEGADQFFHIGVEGHGSDWIQDFSNTQDDILVFGNTAASIDDFQVNFAETEGAGDSGTDEAFVIYKPTGQIMWALVDGGDQDQILLRIDGTDYDLLA